MINPVGGFIIEGYSVIGVPDDKSTYPNIKDIFLISKSIKFLYLAQLKYCQKIDFEGYPNNNLKYPNIKNIFSISKSII